MGTTPLSPCARSSLSGLLIKRNLLFDAQARNCNPNTQSNSIRRWSTGVLSCHEGIILKIKRDSREFASPPPPTTLCEETERGSVCEPGGGLLSDTESASTLILNASASRLRKNNFLLFTSYSGCCILLTVQMDQIFK